MPLHAGGERSMETRVKTRIAVKRSCVSFRIVCNNLGILVHPPRTIILAGVHGHYACNAGAHTSPQVNEQLVCRVAQSFFN